jgi:hypothetical protein
MAPLAEDQTTRTFCGLALENVGYLVSPAAARFGYQFEDYPVAISAATVGRTITISGCVKNEVTIRPGSVRTGEFMRLHVPSSTANSGLTTSARSSKISKNQVS